MKTPVVSRNRADVAFLPGSNDFILEGVRFKVLIGEYHSRKTDDEGVVLLKGWNFVAQELEAIGNIEVRRMLEMGVWQGGSAVLWSLLFPLERYVGIDIAEVPIDFPQIVRDHPHWRAVRLRGNVSQADRMTLDRVIRDDFDGPLDLVCDDASHQYALSRATFEICFPHLRAGGLYILEDWGWAHWPGEWQDPGNQRASAPALSNLVLQLTLLAASRPDVISGIHITNNFAAFTRGPAALAADFDISALTLMRGRQLPLI